MLDILAWIATVFVLLSYFLIGKHGIKQFHWANIISFGFIAGAAMRHGAFPSMTVSIAFGIIAIINLRRGR